MKVGIARMQLLSELQVVSRATAVRSAVQTLAGVLITAGEGKLLLSATDTEIGLRSHVEGNVERDGSILVGGRLLVDVLRSLAGDEVELEHDPSRGELSVRSDGAQFALRTLPVEDFPRLPELEGEGITVSAGTFAETIGRVAKAASRDETRPVLTGILVSVDDSLLRMVATDSYRLSVRETSVETKAPAAFEVNVPARALQELSRVLGDTGVEDVSASSRENQIVFKAGRVTLSSRMIDGQFPNYRQLLPETYEHEIHVDRSEFLAVARRVSLMAQRNAPLRLRFETGSVTMSAQTPDVGEASETLPVDYQGEPLEIGFNPQFLQDGLESVGSDELVLKLISPLRPGLIEAARDSEGEDRFLYLIMPVRLNV
jgi:DNA polymerase III subunit beta